MRYILILVNFGKDENWMKFTSIVGFLCGKYLNPLVYYLVLHITPVRHKIENYNHCNANLDRSKKI